MNKPLETLIIKTLGKNSEATALELSLSLGVSEEHIKEVICNMVADGFIEEL